MSTLLYHDTKFTDPDLFNEREVSVMSNEKISILSINGQIKDKKSSNWAGTITQDYEVETDTMKHLYKFIVKKDGYVYYVLFSSPKNDFNHEEAKRVMDSFTVLSPDNPTTTDEPDKTSGGCLIATATYGTELAPQVQLLREVRDNVLFSTNSGTSFMDGFNSVYYSFSPTIADWERQNPMFREIVKMTITPMLSTLSILDYIDIDSEQEMLGYRISIILLNVGMYFVVPAIVILKIRQRLS